MSWNPERSPGGSPLRSELSHPTKIVLVGALLVLVLFASQLPSPSVAVDAGSIPGSDGGSITPGIVLSASPESLPLDVRDDDATAFDATTMETFAVSESSQAIDTLLADELGIYGVQLVMADGTIGYSYNADTPFVSASLYKLVLIADVYSGIAEGSVRPDLELTLLPEYFPADGDFEDSVYTVADHNTVISIEQLLYVTGAYSSNVAAEALLSITDVESLE